MGEEWQANSPYKSEVEEILAWSREGGKLKKKKKHVPKPNPPNVNFSPLLFPPGPASCWMKKTEAKKKKINLFTIQNNVDPLRSIYVNTGR